MYELLSKKKEFNMRLINTIYEYECIWNPINHGYRNSAIRANAMNAISNTMNISGYYLI